MKIHQINKIHTSMVLHPYGSNREPRYKSHIQLLSLNLRRNIIEMHKAWKAFLRTCVFSHLRNETVYKRQMVFVDSTWRQSWSDLCSCGIAHIYWTKTFKIEVPSSGKTGRPERRFIDVVKEDRDRDFINAALRKFTCQSSTNQFRITNQPGRKPEYQERGKG